MIIMIVRYIITYIILHLITFETIISILLDETRQKFLNHLIE